MKTDTFGISAMIGRIISSLAPRIEYTDEDIRRARSEFTEEDIAEMKELGLMKESFEEFYIMREFISRLPFSEELEGDYIAKLFYEARLLDGDEFTSDPYMKQVKIRDVKKGDILLTYAHYEKGEIFQYDMPLMERDQCIPRLGAFNKTVCFPALYEGDIPWVSVCPSEINSMRGQIDEAFGRVLVLGLGLGYYPFMISAKENVERITIVEIEPGIIDIFREHILPFFPYKDKIEIVCDDALKYMKKVGDGEFDFIFADIWEGAVDGAPLYESIKTHEKRLTKTVFTYWIKDEIEAYLREKK